MSRQVINTGSALADRTGDNGRVAFTKVNENFEELYGVIAVGDGVTDDGAEILAADAALSAAGGGTLYFGPGTYLTSVELTPSSGCHWVGAGREATTLKLADGSNVMLVSFDSVSDCSIRGMTLDGNRANQTADSHCLRLGDGTQERITIEDLKLIDGWHYGIGGQGGTNIGVRIQNIDISGTGADGIDFKNRNDDNADLLFENIRVSDWDRRGIGAQAAIDIRGPARLNNICVADPPSTEPDGIRFVAGELLDDFGYGGHKSSLTNFDIRMDGAGTATHGVEIRARDVTVGFGYVHGVSDGVNVTSDALRARVVAVTCEDCLDDSFVLAGDDSEAHGCVALGGDTALNISGDRVRVFGGRADGCDEGFIISGNADRVELAGFNIANSVTREGQVSSGVTSARIRGGTWDGTDLLDNGTDTLLEDVGGFVAGFGVQGVLSNVLPESSGGFKTAFSEATRSGVTGATSVATNLIPAGARVISITTRVNTALGTGNGTTGYTVGDGSDADRWGVATTVTAGTQTGAIGAGPPTADPAGYFAAAQSVTLTAVGGNFDGIGVIHLVCVYTDGVPPTS
jgi:hypothetical protein